MAKGPPPDDWHWRNTMKPVRFFNFDGRAGFFLVLFIVRAGWQQITSTQSSIDPPAKENPLEKHWLAACIAAICAFLVGNLFLFEVAATATLFWLLLAITTAATITPSTSAMPTAVMTESSENTISSNMICTTTAFIVAPFIEAVA